MPCTDAAVDFLRGLTVFADNRVDFDRIPETNDWPAGYLVKPVRLCPGARIYSYTFSARWLAPTDGSVEVPDILAYLQLQDSFISLPSYGCAIAEIRADLPGLELPAFALLIAAPRVFATLNLNYGHCT